MKTVLAAAAVIVAFCFPATAADMRMPVKAPALTAGYNWTGPYLGAHAGYGWGNSDTSFTSIDTLIFGPGQTLNHLPRSLSPDNSGFIGGLQAGYNWQAGAFVYGLEVDASFSDLHDRAIADIPASGGFPRLVTTQDNDLKWLATLRGRLGYTIAPTALVYVTGGLAIGGVESSTTLDVPPPGGPCPLGNAFCSVGSKSETLVGWTLGVGAEYAFAANWTARLEYLHVDLGSSNYASISTANFGIGGQQVWRSSAEYTAEIVRLGVNYKY